MDAETIETLLELLNPLHGSLDRQTYDEKLAENFDAPRDRTYAVDVTAQQERDLTQAVLILERRKNDGNGLEQLLIRTYAACSKAFNLIDNYSGDTDPHDEDHPLLLACQTLADVLAELAAPGEPFAKLSCHNFEIAKARRQG
jgi:hypothetical protein